MKPKFNSVIYQYALFQIRVNKLTLTIWSLIITGPTNIRKVPNPTNKSPTTESPIAILNFDTAILLEPTNL